MGTFVDTESSTDGTMDSSTFVDESVRTDTSAFIDDGLSSSGGAFVDAGEENRDPQILTSPTKGRRAERHAKPPSQRCSIRRRTSGWHSVNPLGSLGAPPRRPKGHTAEQLQAITQAHAPELVGLPWLSLEAIPTAALVIEPHERTGLGRTKPFIERTEVDESGTVVQNKGKLMAMFREEDEGETNNEDFAKSVELPGTLGNLLEALEHLKWRQEHAPMSSEEVEGTNRQVADVSKVVRTIMQI